MSERVVGVAPFFRSETQLDLLTALFAVNAPEYTVSDLARHISAHQTTVSREVARLSDYGVVTTRTHGRNRYVTANWDLPWATDLQGLLTKTAGVLGLLTGALSPIGGIDQAYVYGSWAARYQGVPGPAPRDIDVLVIGNTSDKAVRRACRTVGKAVGLDVNAVVIQPDRWADNTADDGFLTSVRDGPLVPIPLVQSARV